MPKWYPTWLALSIAAGAVLLVDVAQAEEPPVLCSCEITSLKAFETPDQNVEAWSMLVARYLGLGPHLPGESWAATLLDRQSPALTAYVNQYEAPLRESKSLYGAETVCTFSVLEGRHHDVDTIAAEIRNYAHYVEMSSIHRPPSGGLRGPAADVAITAQQLLSQLSDPWKYGPSGWMSKRSDEAARSLARDQEELQRAKTELAKPGAIPILPAGSGAEADVFYLPFQVPLGKRVFTIGRLDSYRTASDGFMAHWDLLYSQDLRVATGFWDVRLDAKGRMTLRRAELVELTGLTALLGPNAGSARRQYVCENISRAHDLVATNEGLPHHAVECDGKDW